MYKYGRKKLGLKELTAIGIGGMIGGGIFAVLGLSIKIAGPLAPIAFSIAGLIAFLTAYSYAKFSYYHPCMGGTIEYIAMGIEKEKLVGYLSTLLWVSYIVMLSLYSFAFGSYGAALLGFKEGTLSYTFIQHVLITAILLTFMFINLLGAEIMGKIEDFLVYIKVAILLFFTVIGLLHSDPELIFKQPWPPLHYIIAGGMIIFLAYEGFELISNAGLDADNKKDLYWAFFLSVSIVVAIYVLIAYVSVTTLPVNEIVKYKDYALAVIAEPLLGKIGFVLIGIAALYSTASAINATIYGAGRIAYLIFKHGELKEPLRKKAWNQPKEGVLMTSLAAVVLANTYSLANISLMGSLGFLLVFLAVNYSAHKLADKIGASKSLTLAGTILTLVSAIILVYVALSMNFWSQLKALLTLMVPPAIIEIVWRKISRRKMKKPKEYGIYKVIEYIEQKL
ncbi:amino acid transporter [Ignicoccus pacificus DSM 13166]|uniref:Amino acid transporter n=1 Tax=Ignicoccus pacificus DSM 13166 TaxID=940294 RepID=A0A977K8V9_9CREN|nr:amino acid transporter [Ignicoccus pacificus DSM 13166]